jgi:Na+-transporting NADH:ubiquinone oxidoreductase subunit NqrB
VAAQLPNTGRPGARSSGGRGLARPVVPGGVSLLALLLSTRSIVVTNAASIAIITATAKSMVAVRWLFRSLFMREHPQLRKNAMRLGWFPASACDCQNAVLGQFDMAGLLTGKWKFGAHVPAMATIVQCNCGAEYRRTEEKVLGTAYG